MTYSNSQATQKQMSYLGYLADQAGFTGHMQANAALTGQPMYSGSRTYPTSREASRLINALLDGAIQAVDTDDIDESWEDLDEWDRVMSDLTYQASKGYMDDVQDTMVELEDLASRLPSKADDWAELVAEYNYS